MSFFHTRQFFLTLLICSLFFLFFFRSGIALRLSGDFDEQCYLAKVEKLVRADTPGCADKSHFPGIALLWFPGAGLGRIIALILKEPTQPWVAAFSGFSSFFFWCLTAFLIQKIILHYYPSSKQVKESFLFGFLGMSFLLLLNIPSFYFSFARNLMAHSGEVFLSFLFLYFTIKNKPLHAGIALVFLILTRPNNLGAGMVYLTAFGMQRRTFFFWTKWLGLLSVLMLVGYFGFYKGYNETYLIPSLVHWDIDRLALFFFRTDLGILWNQTLWALVFLLAFFRLSKLSPFQESLLSWMTFSALFTLFWPTAGSSFGYRYLIGSHAASLFLFLEFSLVYRSFFLRFRKGIGFLLALTSLWGINLYWSSTAPPPFWPWQDPFLKTMSPPFWILENWWLRTSDMLRLIQFSSLGQILCLLGAPEPYLTFKGEQIPYFFEGPLKTFSLSLTFLVLGVLFFSMFKLTKLKSK